MIKCALAKLIRKQDWCTLPEQGISENLKSISVDIKKRYHKFYEHQEEIQYISSNSILELDCETPENCLIISRPELEDMLTDLMLKKRLLFEKVA